MGDEDEGDADRALQRAQFKLHLFAQFLVERRKRFIQQQNLGPQDEGAGKGHALALAARKAGPRRDRQGRSA